MPKRKKKAGGGGARRPALSAADRIARDIGALVLEQQANSSSNDEHDDGADLSTAADAGAGAACTPCKGPEQQGPCEPPATPSPPLPSPQRTLGLPNLHWNATPLSELRSSRHPRFMGLPKEEHVSLGCPHAFRFLRQDGQAWRQLHSGALTTGCLSDLLGLKEPAAAALLHMNKGMVGHHHQVAACENLRQQPDPRWHGRCSTGCSGDGQQQQQQSNGVVDNNRQGHTTPIAPASAAVVAGPCHAACLAANLGSVERVNAAAGPSGSSWAAEWQLQHQQLLHDIVAAKAGPQGVRMAWGKTQEGSALAALTRLFPSSMLHEVGLMVPPPDALPAAPSGSVWVQQQRQTDSTTPLPQPFSATTTTCPLFGQATASFSSASSASAPAPTQLPLPLLGASPDGIICHHVPGIPRHRADWLAATAAACHPAPSCHPPPTSSSSCTSSSASFHCRCCCRGCGSGGGAEGGGLQNGHSGGGRAQQGQAQGGSCSSGGAAAAAVDPALMLNLRFSLLQAVDELLGRVEVNNGIREQRPGDGEERSEDGMSGMSGASSAELSTAEARGAGSGGQLGTGSSAAAAAATAAAAAAAVAAATAATGAQDSPRLRVRESVEHVFASACPVSVLQDNLACGQAADPPSVAPAPPGPYPPPAAVEEGRRAIASVEGCHGQRQPQPEAPETCTVLIREIVEVKCCCPFACLEPHQPKRGGGHRRGGGGGGGKRTWVVSDRGPYEAFAPAWVPQMQLHMLASGCWSGLLVSWSATKGMRVFRMRRDDEYLARMLSLVSRVYRSHVVPPANLYRNDAEHHAFLHHTLRLARAAKVVADVAADGLALQPRARPQDAFV